MNHIFLLNKLIKYLLSLTIIVLCITDCSKVPVDKTNDSELLGDIYGKIFISKKNESLENTSVFISNNPSYSANTDSNGFFFISRIPAGKYSVIARKEGFADSKVTMVDVAIDSITLLSQHFISNSPSQSVWVGIKIKRVNISNKGNIKGSVMDAHTNKAVTGAWVYIKDTPWVAYTDSTGNYTMQNILPGVYNVVALKGRFHRTKILSVLVKSGQTSLVHFRLIHEGIPEEPLPYNWEPVFIKN